MNKKECCGCSACTQICPKKSITLLEDNEGFLYPHINTKTCIDCGLCEKVCPVLTTQNKRDPLHVYAAKNQNEIIRKNSSSGGVFSVIAEYIIKQGGIVFGARFDKSWEVKHDYTETIGGLNVFYGSKYLQSRIENNYQIAEKFLKKGRKVLFSGTPCQIAGLYCYLRKDYPNLLTIDVICHGVPSPKVWRLYLKECCYNLSTKTTTCHNIKSIQNISFRNKQWGWKKFSFLIETLYDSNIISFIHEPINVNTYMKGFLADLYLRPSCHQCYFKSGKSKSDISIADYWNISNVHPSFDDDKGVSLVLVNSEKGNSIYQSIQQQLDSISSNYHLAQLNNGGFKDVIKKHPNREKFFNEIQHTDSIVKSINKNIKLSLLIRIINRINRIL